MHKKQEIMKSPEAAWFTMTRIEKLARAALATESAKKWLDDCIDRRMRQWVKLRLEDKA